MEIKTLENVDGLEDALAVSSERPILLFKHSTTCPVSANAYKELRRFLESDGDGAEVRLIVVQSARSVSDRAAELLGVRHESPQAIVVRDGRAVWNASHFDITSRALLEALRTA